ncbi:protein kinase [Streptomyces thermocarboxydovorans]|uniref:protein kinase n=1 Tax=Streptomyces thermocarboxydovorans TaxID=59298 RepID=UPI0031E45F51
MDDYAGRVLADRYRLPLPPSDEYELTETRAFDTYSGQEVLVRQVPLPEVVEAEVLDAEGLPEGFTARDGGARRDPGRPPARSSTRRPTDPVVRRAVEAAQAAAAIPDHPRLDQVFDVFAEGGSLWVVSELVAARPLAALLAEKPLTPYRAAEVASDVLMALRALHAHGWVHRNITARTVLVCDDGRVMLTGLAVGAAEEALCGYDPVPPPPGSEGSHGSEGPQGSGVRASAPDTPPGAPGAQRNGAWPPGSSGGPSGTAAPAPRSDPEALRRAAIEARAGHLRASGDGTSGGGVPAVTAPRALGSAGDIRAARAGAIAAYRAGARAAARVQEAQQSGRASTALPGARTAPEGGRTASPGQLPAAPGSTGPHTNGSTQSPYSTQVPYPAGPGQQGSGPGAPGVSGVTGGGSGAGPASTGTQPPGQIADPYGVAGAGRPGAASRTGTGIGSTAPALGAGAQARTALPSAGSDEAAPAPGADRSPAPLAPARWDELAAQNPVPRGPTSALAAERARQARMAVVGPVTERWAPEQAGPVHENWQLAPPIGPATDLWALGALLFRAVQGHAPYPEESTAELVQMVCAEPPAFAEECGPLRPIVESLLRQDPTERPDVEELRGWLRSLVRSAPEPDAGLNVITAPPLETSRLPVVRRRGELVRKRRAGLPAHHGRHKRAKQRTRSPHRLGRTLLLLVLLLLAGAVAYATLFMPKAGEDTSGAQPAGGVSQAPPSRAAGGAPGSDDEAGRKQETPKSRTASSPEESAGSTETQTTVPEVAEGFTLRKDPEGFQIAVAEKWQRTGKNGSGQIVYSRGDFELIVVPGRDSAERYGSDPMAYQRDDERELQPYRDSSWATSTGLKTIEVGGRTMAEGQFTWTAGDGDDLYVRNLAALIDGRYHVIQVRGPEGERDEVTRLYEQAAATYRFTG